MKAWLLTFISLLPLIGCKSEPIISAQNLEKLEIRLEQKDLKLGAPIFIRAFKEERELELFVLNEKTQKYILFRTFPILGSSGILGPKKAEGDRQVPEGFYYSTRNSLNPNSRYHLSFNIGYPNNYDRAHGHTGSFIMIHGSNVSIGCLAMGDPQIEEIYHMAESALDGGQEFFRIHIFPFRMTEQRMQRATDHRWFHFWKNLKTGYDYFEQKGTPPNVTVSEKRYVFE